MLKPEPEMGVIGKLPGYNPAIDPRKEFQNQLLKGLTFIDMIPTSYDIQKSILDDLKGNTDPLTTIKNTLNDINEAGTIFQHSSGDTRPTEIFQGILKRMQVGMSLGSSFATAKSLRIIGANDSTFTESFSNAFDGENGLLAPLNNLQNGNGLIGKVSKGVNTAMSGIKNVSHAQAMSFMQQGTGGGLFKDLLVGQAIGISFAKPNTWSRSQYNSTLSIFIKLVSPSGHPSEIKRNIMEPLMYLFAAGSPITSRGMTYGLPLIWDIHAHGITRFKVGAISSMTLSRGSFETTFNNNLQPTNIDVRLTITPLIQDFAVQHQLNANKTTGNTVTDKLKEYNAKISSEDPNMYNQQTKNLGVQHPGDVYQGSLNSIPGSTSGASQIRTINL